MKIEKVLDIRFIVPPLLTVFFVFLFSPSEFLDFLKENKNNIDVSMVLFGSIGVFPLGFLISSISEKFIVKSRLSEMYGPKELSLLENRFSFWKEEITKEDVSTLELINWINLYKIQKDGHIADQVHKRWNMAMANYNSFVGLIIAVIIIVIGLMFDKFYFPRCPWLALWIATYSFFLYVLKSNGDRTINSVFSINRKLITYLQHMNKHEASQEYFTEFK